MKSIAECSFDAHHRPAVYVIAIPGGIPPALGAPCALIWSVFEGGQIHPIDHIAALEALSAAQYIVEAGWAR